jgi:hypothetical protein
VHDVRAARDHGMVDALAEAGIKCWVEKGYRGARRHGPRPVLGLVGALPQARRLEPAVASLKAWRLLRELRCSTTRITKLVQAVLTCHLTSSE